MKLWHTPAAMMLVAMTACSNQAELTSADLAQMKGDLSYLKSSQARQDEMHAILLERVKALESAAIGAPKAAYFDPAGGTGYQYISTNVSPVIISFIDVAPIGDGAKIRLKVGNLSTATFAGVRLDVRYNKRAPEDGSQLEAWRARIKDSSANDASELAPGAWSVVEASLPGIKPDELGYVEVSAHLDSLKLRVSY